jgi:steroid 5-alpha reductase family enzyme
LSSIHALLRQAVPRWPDGSRPDVRTSPDVHRGYTILAGPFGDAAESRRNRDGSEKLARTTRSAIVRGARAVDSERLQIETNVPMNPEPLAVVLGFSTAVLLGGWLFDRRMRHPALADLLWAACLSSSALYYGLVAGGALLPRLLVAMMGGIGGFRLFMHLLQRVLVEPAEQARARIGDSHARLGALSRFVAKAVSATLFSVPLYVAASNPHDQASATMLLAAVVYAIGLSGETYADIQLARFREGPRLHGLACRHGLWRYSRHPNYFFAFVHWCSYALLAVGLPWPLWSLTLIAPALMLAIALRRIPVVEAAALQTRGESYRAYQATTSAFVPWLPKGWPNEAASWYAPPPQTPRPRVTSGRRSTPLPGARITPIPMLSALAPDGPVTPRAQRVLAAEDDADSSPAASTVNVER